MEGKKKKQKQNNYNKETKTTLEILFVMILSVKSRKKYQCRIIVPASLSSVGLGEAKTAWAVAVTTAGESCQHIASFSPECPLPGFL